MGATVFGSSQKILFVARPGFHLLSRHLRVEARTRLSEVWFQAVQCLICFDRKRFGNG
ncbi:hypothetical protein DSCA_37980 [Desulfosarcina alkanivorans]|uniref:Uncharacterized protein n=1 Tax=Desulfosarcina alkanivorans TaxID=571177 RepID=A0A5K7YM16_9BACT|nr:hypothetical protein DSCA_37980 [Desulfosarcina alkanivorans]